MRWLVAVLICMFGGLSSTVQAQDEAGSDFVVIGTQPINVRTAPTTVSSVVATLQPGETVTLLTTAEGTVVSNSPVWYEIEIASGDTGFIHSSLLLPADEIVGDPLVGFPGRVETVVVRGVGFASAQPDIAVLRLGIERVGAAAASVYDEMQSIQTAVTSSMTAFDITPADIEMGQIMLRPEDRIEGGSVTGDFIFRASLTMQIMVRDVQQVPDVLQTAVANGANIIEGVAYFLEDTAALEQQALAAALSNALDEARVLSGVSQFIATDTVVIQDISVERLAFDELTNPTRRELSRAPLQIGQVTVRVELQVEILLRNVRR